MATTYNLAIDQGTDFSNTFTLKDSSNTVRNLTGYTGKAHLRRSYASTSNVAFTINIANPTNGNVVVTLSNAVTANLKYGRYVYDLELVNSNTLTVERVVEGIVTVYPEATK